MKKENGAGGTLRNPYLHMSCKQMTPFPKCSVEERSQKKEGLPRTWVMRGDLVGILKKTGKKPPLHVKVASLQNAAAISVYGISVRELCPINRISCQSACGLHLGAGWSPLKPLTTLARDAWRRQLPFVSFLLVKIPRRLLSSPTWHRGWGGGHFHCDLQTTKPAELHRTWDLIVV